MDDDQEEIGRREKLEQEQATAHAIARAEARRIRRHAYYSDSHMPSYSMCDAKGHPLDDENDPLLARLEAGLR